jgi:hypothetical protein
MKRAIALILIILGAGAIFMLCIERFREDYRDSYVASGVIETPMSHLSLHAAFQPRYLQVFGKTYKNVRGDSPYYISLTNISCILFVTEPTKYGMIFNVLNLTNRAITRIDGKRGGFGYGINGPHRDGDAFKDYIESATPNHIVAVRGCDGCWQKYYLDLVHGKLTKVVEEYYNNQKEVTNSIVYPNGTALYKIELHTPTIAREMPMK